MSTLQLESSEGATFDVPIEFTKISAVVENMLGDVEYEPGESPVVRLMNVKSGTLEKIVEWFNYHHKNPPAADCLEKTDPPKDPLNYQDPARDIIPWDAEFCSVEQSTLFDIMLAANYLNIEKLLKLTCKTLAIMLRGKTPTEIREAFGIKNDLEDKEIIEMRKENKWFGKF